jgi:cytochrome c peroxidase
MVIRLRPLSVLAMLLLSSIASARSLSDGGAVNREPITVIEPPPVLDSQKVTLGQQLFNDPILSGKNELACSSCHDLEKGGTAPLKRTIGYNGRMHRYNAPTIFNVANNYRLGWRGNFTSLRDQNEEVLLDPNLMASDWATLMPKLKGSQYRPLFVSIYGRDPSADDLLDALVTFQRSLATPNSRFDRYLKGDSRSLSQDEVRGFELFKNYGCVSCHQGSNIGGNLFQKFGIFAPAMANPDPTYDGDLGRFTITGKPQDKGVFRVPSLRNVALTAPYFHDGRADTLPQAVRTMARNQLGEEIESDDVELIVDFLKTLTGEYKGVPLDVPPKGN